jgi:plasmid stability protein
VEFRSRDFNIRLPDDVNRRLRARLTLHVRSTVRPDM